MSSFVVARWVYNVVPISAKGKAEVGFPNGKKVVGEKREGWSADGKAVDGQ